MKLFTVFLVTTVSLLAYELKPVKINPYTYCFIGDTAPVSKENGGFISNICLLKSDNSIIALDAGPTYQFAKELECPDSQRFEPCWLPSLRSSPSPRGCPRRRKSFFCFCQN